MQQTYKAKRCTIHIGNTPLEVAMLSDGNYCLSQTEVSTVVEKPESSIRSFRQSKRAKAQTEVSTVVEKPESSIRSFRQSKRAKALLQEDLQFATLAIVGASKPIAPVTLELAALNWYKYAIEGNKKAQALVIALLKRSP